MTYLHDNVEVKATGRVATRKIGKSTSRVEAREEKKLEITPVDETTGTWKKWIKECDLFVIDTPTDQIEEKND